ncbi:TIGR03364 family FAD-dependent oxidoreductase [Leucobacter sp. HY1910]
MTSSHTPLHVVIVGAGIVGLGHAVAALDAGYRVTVLEQDAQAVTASVRNFGHVCASVQAGELGELARASLPIWESLITRAGAEGRRSGTIAVARTAAEEAVLTELAAGLETEGSAAASSGSAQPLTGQAVAAQLRLPSSATPRAGLFLPGDLTANPRTAVAQIAAWVGAHERGEVRFGETVYGAATGEVFTSRGRITCDRVVVAAGHLVGRLFPEVAAAGEVRECALQMARVRAPRDMGLGPAVLTGTSMLRYGAFAGEAQAALRAELERERPELIEIDANVMLTQQADGTLLVGDSHVSHDSAPPFLDERWSDILLAEAAALLGTERLEVLERWQGVYATSTKQQLLVAEPTPGVHVVSVTTGTGMTVGLGLGARTVAGFAHALTH